MKGKRRAEKVSKYAEANSKKVFYDKDDPNRREVQFEKKFFDHWLTCESVIAPSNIKWRNVNVTFCERLGRTCGLWFFCLLLIIIAFCLMVWFKDFGDGITRLADSNIVCPEDGIDPSVAAWDYMKHPK
jgi:Mg2+ and Co2+ transporter CorA